jgi:hypothetical protein
MFDFWDHDNDSGGFFIFLYPIPLVRTPGGSLAGPDASETFPTILSDRTGVLTRAIIRSLEQVRMHQQPA